MDSLSYHLSIRHRGKVNEDEIDDLTFEEEWRIVAMTLDRFLFIFFILALVVGTIACFVNVEWVD